MEYSWIKKETNEVMNASWREILMVFLPAILLGFSGTWLVILALEWLGIITPK